LYPFDGGGNPSFLVDWGSGASATAWLLGPNWSLEDIVVISARDICPVVALGPANSTRGAVRLSVSDVDWQSTVSDLAERAAAIVFFPGSGSGLSWEFTTLTSNASLFRKTLVMSVSSKRSEELARSIIGRDSGDLIDVARELKISVAELVFNLIEGIYFADQVSGSEWEWFHLSLEGGHPSHIGSLLWMTMLPSPAGTRVKTFSRAGLDPIPVRSADGRDKAVDRALNHVRLQHPRVAANAVFGAMEAILVASVLASLAGAVFTLIR
jgi:hypothetical protein